MKGIAKSLLVCFTVATFHSAHSEEHVSLPSRPGVETHFFYEGVEKPAAQVILFEGGDGQVTGKNAGFVQKTRKMYPKHDISYAMFEMPSNLRSGNVPQQVVGAYRVSDEHIRDVEVVIAWLRQKSPAPVWLAGVSAGTISVAWLASRVREPIAGVVFSSSVLGGSPRRVGTVGLEFIRMPTLITHHRKDACARFHDPLMVEPVFTRRLPPDTKREIVFFEGGSSFGSDPCKQNTFHTYNGMEAEVVAVIAKFIKDNSPR